MYELALMKADLLIYCEELIRAPKTNSSWSDHSIFHSQEMKIYNIMHDLQSKNNVYWKHQLHEKSHIKYYILTLTLLNLRALTYAFTYLS